MKVFFVLLDKEHGEIVGVASSLEKAMEMTKALGPGFRDMTWIEAKHSWGWLVTGTGIYESNLGTHPSRVDATITEYELDEILP